MNRTLFTIAIFTSFSSTFIYGQNEKKFPTLQQLESYCKLKSNVDFAKEAKSFGFSFEAKYARSYGMDYVYVRQTVVNGVVITDRFIYEYFTRNSTVLIQIATAQTDFSELYKIRIGNTYKLGTCLGSTDSNELETCYSNNLYYLRICDLRKTFSTGTSGNVSTILINRQKKQ